MPEDYLGDNLQRHPAATGIGCRIPSEIMGSENNIQFSSQVLDQCPGRGIAKRKDAGSRGEILLLDVVMEPFGDLFRHKGMHRNHCPESVGILSSYGD